MDSTREIARISLMQTSQPQRGVFFCCLIGTTRQTTQASLGSTQLLNKKLAAERPAHELRGWIVRETDNAEPFLLLDQGPNQV